MATLNDILSTAIQAKGLSFVLGSSPDLQGNIGGEHVYSSEQLYQILVGNTTGYTYGSNTPSTNGKFTFINEGSNGKFKADANNTNIIFGSGDDDKITGTTNALGQVIFGMDGNDTITGRGTGPNFLSGNDGGDTITGGRGADEIHGDQGADKLKGGAGADKIFGGTGNDNIDGGAGDDVITGGPGNDRLKGGGGADTFNFSNNDGKQTDVILDFGKGGDDKIRCTDGLKITGHTASADGKSTIVNLSDGSKIILKGVNAAKFTDHVTEVKTGTDVTGLDWG